MADFDVAGFRRQLGWGELGQETVVLHAGAMGHKQDLGNVVAAARLADAQDLPLRFVLLGDGSQRPALEEAAQGVVRIEFRSQVDDETFGRALRAADVLLVNESAGLREMAVPSKLTSYFQTGRPTLAATAPESTTATEINVSGGGLLVPPGQPQELLDGVRRLAAEPERAAEYGRAGQAYCRTVLSEDHALAAYAALVVELADEARTRDGQHQNTM